MFIGIAQLGLLVILGAIIFMALNLTLRKTFLYIFASVGLVLSIIGLVSIINLGLRTYVLTKSDYPCDYMYATPAVKEPGTPEVSDAEKARQEKSCLDQRTSEKQRQAANAIAMLIVGIPLYTYNWYVIRRDKEI